jgi:hypothetical protein
VYREGRDLLCSHGLKALAAELRCPVCELCPLAPRNNTLYADAPAHKKVAEWCAGLWNGTDLSAGIHLRRIRYGLVSRAEPIRMIDGTGYLNTGGALAAPVVANCKALVPKCQARDANR